MNSRINGYARSRGSPPRGILHAFCVPSACPTAGGMRGETGSVT
jgi:hypothetical protein